MKLALGLLPPASGIVRNQAVRPIPVMQNFYSSLLPWFNVKKNLLFGIGADREASFDTIASLFEIDAYLQSPPTELSGGQLQRVLFARALCQQPDIILVDEPFSHLDLPTSNRILTRLDAFLSERKISVFWITHRHFEARLLAHHVIHLEHQTLRKVEVHELGNSQSFAA